MHDLVSLQPHSFAIVIVRMYDAAASSEDNYTLNERSLYVIANPINWTVLARRGKDEGEARRWKQCECDPARALSTANDVAENGK